MLRTFNIFMFPRLQASILSISPRYKTTKPEDLEDQVVLSKDKRTVVCWHPEKPFPYECSQPLPEKIVEENSTPLKIQATQALKNIYRQKPAELQRLELMKITYTTKHPWFPNKRKFKRKNTPMDRPYL